MARGEPVYTYNACLRETNVRPQEFVSKERFDSLKSYVDDLLDFANETRERMNENDYDSRVRDDKLYHKIVDCEERIKMLSHRLQQAPQRGHSRIVIKKGRNTVNIKLR